MAIWRPATRLIFVAGMAVAPMAASAMASPSAVADDCPAGLTLDVYTVQCVPELVPTGGGGAPSESNLTACSGRDQGQCIENQLYGPGRVPVPNVDTGVQQSP